MANAAAAKTAAQLPATHLVLTVAICILHALRRPLGPYWNARIPASVVDFGMLFVLCQGAVCHLGCPSPMLLTQRAEIETSAANKDNEPTVAASRCCDAKMKVQP